MGKFIKFDTEYDEHGKFITADCQDALENYFMRGYSPGGFLTAVLENDLYRAVGCADVANRKVMWHVAKWIMFFAPGGSWGSKETVANWIKDTDEIRTKFSTEISKEFVWRKLSGVENAANS